MRGGAPPTAEAEEGAGGGAPADGDDAEAAPAGAENAAQLSLPPQPLPAAGAKGDDGASAASEEAAPSAEGAGDARGDELDGRMWCQLAHTQPCDHATANSKTHGQLPRIRESQLRRSLIAGRDSAGLGSETGPSDRSGEEIKTQGGRGRQIVRWEGRQTKTVSRRLTPL